MKHPEAHKALLTDLYELTMAAGYFEHKVDCNATFELFVRNLPPERSFLVACGLESAFEYLETLHFTGDEVDFLRRLPAFQNVSPGFFEYLRHFRFSGEVNAVAEGTPVFAEEPILQVTAPVLEAQIVETYLLSVINFETLVATKAARTVRAARGKSVLEFGTRRAQGPEAGLRAARAAYVGGCDATSNVLAGYLYGVPLAGTAAHSWTQVFPTEQESFEALLDSFPRTGILLIDTYDPLAAIELAVRMGRAVPGVRLDSGDLLEKSVLVRQILDRHGLHDTHIVASGDLNEYKVDELVRCGAPIDSFGVGTDLATSRDVPALSVVYKLVETEQAGREHYKTKFSEQKVYFPGRKQVFRFGSNGQYRYDLIARADETCEGGTPLLQPALEDGRRLQPPPSLASVRAYAMECLAALPEEHQALSGAAPYPVHKTRALDQLLEEVRERYFGAAEGRATGHGV